MPDAFDLAAMQQSGSTRHRLASRFVPLEFWIERGPTMVIEIKGVSPEKTEK